MKGFCHVDFADAASAQNAVAKTGGMMEGREVAVEISTPRPSSGTPRTPRDDSMSVFIKGFDKYQEEYVIKDNLREFFGECGEIISIRVRYFYSQELTMLLRTDVHSHI